MNAAQNHKIPGSPSNDLNSVVQNDLGPGEKDIDRKSQSEAKSPSLIPSRTCFLDIHGDLWLYTRGTGSWGDSTPTRFKVCSRALARASIVFDIMLYGPFAESEKRASDEDWIIELPEDSSVAMKQLLGIMHGRFRSLTQPVYQCKEEIATKDEELIPDPELEISYTMVEQLYDLTVLADKYNCMHMLQPWATAWIRDLESYPTNVVDEQAMLRKAWIFYQLGSRVEYEKTVTSLILNVPPLSAQQSQGADDALEQLPHALPPHLLDLVRTERETRVAALLETVQSTVSNLLQARFMSVGFCGARHQYHTAVSEESRLACEASLLGHLLRHLHSRKLWPIPAPDRVTSSASDLARLVQDLAKPEENKSNNGQHSECAPKFETKDAAGASIDWAKKTLDFRYASGSIAVYYLSHQARLTGVSYPPLDGMQAWREGMARKVSEKV